MRRHIAPKQRRVADKGINNMNQRRRIETNSSSVPMLEKISTIGSSMSSSTDYSNHAASKPPAPNNAGGEAYSRCWIQWQKVVSQKTADYAKNVLLPSIIKCDNYVAGRMEQLIYVVAVFGSWAIVFAKVYPLVTVSRHVANYHKWIGYGVFIGCVGSWRYARGTGPGSITQESMDRYDSYPYDGFMYVHDAVCPTLKIRKLPRSKYDRWTTAGGTCGRHIPRFDHYCGWLNQPIGEENYRWFVWFLTVHVGMCSYGSYMLYHLLRGEAMDAPGLRLTAIVDTVWSHRLIAAEFLLMSAMVFVLGAFLGFHIYITARGMTTNEYYKWKEIREWHGRAKKDYLHAVENGAIVVQYDDNGKGRMVAKPAPSRGGELTYHQIRLATDGGGGMPETAGDEERNNTTLSGDDGIIINPGPMRQNMYDHGFASNFGEVLFPLSLRKIHERQKDL